MKNNCNYLLFIFFPSNRVRTSWNIGAFRNLFLKLKTKLGLYHVVVTTPKTSLAKLTLTVVELQQVPNIEKSDSEEKTFCLKWTIYNGGRKLCVNFKTDTDNTNIVFYRYRNILYLKDAKIDLKLTEWPHSWQSFFYLLIYKDVFDEPNIVLHEITINKCVFSF